MSAEYKVDISGTTYYMTDIKEVKIEHPLFDKLSVGNTCSAEMVISFWPKGNIPKMAKLVPYARNGTSDSWHKLGGFYTDTRTIKGSIMEIVSYDAMLKSEVEWIPSQDLEFPMEMERAAKIIADLMGLTLDDRCKFVRGYTVTSYPVGGTTLRDVLNYIAAAHAGNWIVTANEQLLLIPLFATLPPETHYLVEEYGNPITFGGTRILI